MFGHQMQERYVTCPNAIASFRLVFIVDHELRSTSTNHQSSTITIQRSAAERSIPFHVRRTVWRLHSHNLQFTHHNLQMLFALPLFTMFLSKVLSKV
jgi:hypothetical protein